MLVFSRNNSTTKGSISVDTNLNVKNMKLYRFTIKEDGAPVVDLLPGRIGEDGAPCLLDACDNWHPLFNAGTGQFSCGAATNDV